ncbi:DEKNAAC102404, partial [Brettanomyces naardenensis]
NVDLEVLTKKSKSKPLIEVTFKDKTVMKGDPSSMTMDDFIHMFDRHSRVLQFKEEISK